MKGTEVMKNMYSMFTIVLGIIILLVVGYVIFPDVRGILISYAPFLLLVLICPLGMMFMDGRSNSSNNDEEKKSLMKDAKKRDR